jgi:hypothetical protein
MYLGAPPSEMNSSLVLTVFVLICLGGMGAAYFPQHYTPSRDQRETSPSSSHHPNCGPFRSHTLLINNKRYCAGCSGLFLGAGLGIIICLFYYIYGFSSPLLFWLGVITVFIVLFQLSYLKLDGARVKFIFNLVLVLGSTSILLGILESKANLGLYFLLLVGLWIYTRTTLSAAQHEEICERCNDPSCPLG